MRSERKTRHSAKRKLYTILYTTKDRRSALTTKAMKWTRKREKTTLYMCIKLTVDFDFKYCLHLGRPFFFLPLDFVSLRRDFYYVFFFFAFV